MPSKGVSLAIAGAGGVFVWSAITGKKWSGILRNLVAGKGLPPAGPLAIQPLANSGYGYGSSAVSVSAPANQSETAWITSLLKGLGAPASSANIRSVTSWIAHEGPWGTQGKNNPLNTTLWMPGATSFDGLAVKNYPTVTVGLAATILTLRGGYPDIVARLKSGQGLCGWSSPEFLKWSGNGYSEVC